MTNGFFLGAAVVFAEGDPSALAPVAASSTALSLAWLEPALAAEALPSARAELGALGAGGSGVTGGVCAVALRNAFTSGASPDPFAGSHTSRATLREKAKSPPTIARETTNPTIKPAVTPLARSRVSGGFSGRFVEAQEDFPVCACAVSFCFLVDPVFLLVVIELSRGSRVVPPLGREFSGDPPLIGATVELLKSRFVVVGR